MSIVGSWLFTRLVLPAIAVQAKEADIDEGHQDHVAPVASVPVNPVYGPGTVRDTHFTSNANLVASPAFASRRDLSLARYRSASPMPGGGDPLLAELMQFRQWQAARQGRGSFGGSPMPARAPTPTSAMSPVMSMSLSPNPGGGMSLSPMPHTAPGLSPNPMSSLSPNHMLPPGLRGATNIIVVNNSNSEYRTSNLGTTRDPGYSTLQGQPDISLLSLPDQNTGLHRAMNDPIVDLDAIREEEEMRKETEADMAADSSVDHGALKLDVNDYPATRATLSQQPGEDGVAAVAAAAESPNPKHNTVEQTKIVPVIEDGQLVNKQVTHTVTYTNDQLYTAATQFYHRLLAEAIGTWALVFFIAGVNIEAGLGHLDQEGVAIATGLVFVFLIYSLGQVSGAHFNPIVTYAFVLRGMFPLTWLPFYWVVQFVGGLIGAAMLLALYGTPRGDAGATIVPDTYSPQAAFFMEAILCFVLVFAILSMASRAKIVGPHAALAIGAVIAFNCFLAGSYSGSSMNPWRSLCVSLVFPVSFYSIWVYFAGPFLGATIAVVAVFALAGKPRSDELTAGIGATIAVAIGNSISRDVENGEAAEQAERKIV